MQNNKTRIDELNTTNIDCGGAANLQGITTCYYWSKSATLGEISTLGRLIGFL